MRILLLGCVAFCAAQLSAQLIPSGAPIPRTLKPPVVFLNGYQNDCSGSTFAGTFGVADQILQSNGEVSLFFDNCSLPNKPPIERLGAAFGGFLTGLRYTDGSPVDQVDVVAHSMGGLIVRSYLSGKQTAPGMFDPPPVTHIRKVVFFAAPHFGTGIALGFGFNSQLDEIASGNRFLFDLATWNQGTDDLRGVDAVTAVGNGGTGFATTKGFDDGVVALTSGSLDFYLRGRTRVLPLCHVDGGGLTSLSGLCDSSARGIAKIRSANDDSARIMISFLDGTSDWQNVGTAPEQDRFLSIDGGLSVSARTADDKALAIDSVTAASQSGQSKKLNVPSHDVAYTDLFPAGPLTLTAVAGAQTVSRSLTLPAGFVDAVVVKPGPVIARVFPSASAVFPLSIAAGELISIYGTALATDSAAQALLNTTPMTLLFVSPRQINAVIPNDAAGLTKLTVQNAGGSHTVNVLVEATVPAIFTQDGSGQGAAAALRARDNALVTSSSPLHAGDFLELFVTGLGATTNRNGLDFADVQPTVTIAGQDCAVSYAGRAPGFTGLDQINCQVPPGLSPNNNAVVVVTSQGRASNVATVAVQ